MEKKYTMKEDGFIGLWVADTGDTFEVENPNTPCHIGLSDGETTFFISGGAFKEVIKKIINAYSEHYCGGAFSSKNL